MKILIITHASTDNLVDGKKGRWQFLPHNFKKLGNEVKYLPKKGWWKYPFVYSTFKPDVVISVGRIAGVITALHHMVKKNRSAPLMHDLTDHPHFYGSDRRIRFIIKHHDYVTTPTEHNLKTYGCSDLIPNGSDFKPIKSKIKYDACYIGQVHSFYNVDKLKQQCEKEGIKLKVVSGLSSEEVPKYVAESKICVYPISWDSSLKITDYAAMSKPVVAVRPNLAEKVGYPAYYTTDLVKGIKYLLKHPKKAAELGKKSRKWFLKYSGTWEEQAKKYLSVLEKYLRG